MAQLSDAYQSAVWEGIERRVQELGLGVVCFIGSRLESPVGSEKKANIAYGLSAAVEQRVEVVLSRDGSAGAELSIEDLEPGTRICCRIPHAVEG
jgi:hypothetical protein